MRILIVDDELEVCRTLSMTLTSAGHMCVSVLGASDALRQLAEHPFDVILTDLGMPGMNGLELAELIMVRIPHARIILVTGWPIQLTTEELRGLGIEHVLTKPVSRSALLSAVDPFVEADGNS